MVQPLWRKVKLHRKSEWLERRSHVNLRRRGVCARDAQALTLYSGTLNTSGTTLS